MHKILRSILLPALVSAMLAGCSVPIPGAGGSEGEAASVTDTGNGRVQTAAVNDEENERIKSLINDYFTCLYSEPAVNCYNYTLQGKLPPKLKDFISKKTVSLAEGNPEIGIHLPRFVEINGLTAIWYDIARLKEGNGEGRADINTEYAGSNRDSLFYFTKVNLYAKCVDNEAFASLYACNPPDNSWQKKDNLPVDENLADIIRVQAKYDVELTKEDGNFKVVTVKEANTLNPMKNRINVNNNDFLTRLSYLDNSKREDGKTYRNETDGKTYEAEKAVITSFFDTLRTSLNAENMKLMRPLWDKGAADFKAFMGKISAGGGADARKLNELTDIQADYRTKFDIESFPLQMNMDSLDGKYRNFEVVPHPGYTKKNKRYLVSFEVGVKKANGMVEGVEYIYRYDYAVALAKTNEALKISSIRLNECSRVQNGANTTGQAVTQPVAAAAE